MRFLGIFLFVVLIFITILFAEGYQVDPKTRDLVKKSVIYFDGVKAPSGDEISVFLDGKLITRPSHSEAFPLELRVAPGAHDVVIVSEHTSLWKKRIFVPEETVLRFPEIQLFPNAPNIFTKSLESIQSFIPQADSEDGAFLLHPRLHFGKFYSFENFDAPWVQNIPFISKNLRLIPLSEDFWFGITAEGKLFSYDTILRRPTPRPSHSEAKQLMPPDVRRGATFRADFAVQDARLFGETLFLLDREGKIWKFREEDTEPQFLFRIISPISHIRRIEESHSRMMFLFDRLVVVAQDDGALLFQEPDVESATLDSDNLFYTKGESLMRFDVREKKLISTHPLKEPISFLSRIGATFHFLFVTASFELFMCDEDFENCHSFGKIDEERIVVSEKRTRFFVPQNGELILIDFEEPDILPEFLQNLVSVLENARKFE